MKTGGFVFWLVLALCFIQNLAFSQNISNEGTDFWAVFPSHDPQGNNLARIRIYVTSKTALSVRVTCGAYDQTQNIPANSPVPFDVPRSEAYISDFESGQLLNNRGIHIQVVGGQGTVAVYEHIYAGARSAASIILPTEALGQKYYSMNFTQASRQAGTNQNFLTLVATEPNTTVLIHTSSGIIRVPLVNTGDVYQYLGSGDEDLTGTYVEIEPDPANCNKRFAAFSGSTALSIGCDGSVDPLFQQLYSVTSWGNIYGLVSFSQRKYIFRVLAQENGTDVTFNNTTFTLNRGEFYESAQLTQAYIISSNKKISVAQYSLTQACTGAQSGNLFGDPEMVLLNPIEFSVKSATLFSSDDQNINEKYINVFMKTSSRSSFRIDGDVPSGSWTTIPSSPDYSYLQLPVYARSSFLSANDGFNAMAYGFGNHESYAYSAGTNLAINNYLLIKNNTTTQEAPNACVNQSSDIKLIFPSEVNKITLQLDNEPMITITSPVPKIISSVNGETIYEYIIISNKTFSDIGDHKVVVNVEFKSTSGCLGNQQEFIYTFGVEPVPLVKFNTDKTVICESSTIQFFDQSDSFISSKSINKWKWDFGDGTTSEDQNPVHVFSVPGSYTVRLVAGIDDGCLSDFVQNIEVFKTPSVDFAVLPAKCVTDADFNLTQAIETKGLSGVGEYSGPGITSPSGTFSPSLATPGVHTITYVFKSDGGCEDIKTQKITVTPEPAIIVPADIYILEGGELKLNLTDQAVNSKYEWLGADAYLSNPTILNPSIQAGDGDREYKLSVVTEGGCTEEYTITVHLVRNLKPANTFSPNGDGTNDLWVIKYIESYPNVTVQVFNRNGEVVFSSNNYAQPFDGQYKGKALPVGTYYYIIDPKNGQPRLTGSLTIIR